ncbi:MAG: hypothetical protein GF421_07055 [Candidatus Aminicenantes bacterium]|nr:hypothetical protein [Candidatus Aminicenantes bacterium]
MIFILSGPRHSGKTTILKKSIPLLKQMNIPVQGFLSVPVFTGTRVKGYDLFDLKNNTHHPFLRRKGQKHWQEAGRFYFVPSGLIRAQDLISQREKGFLLMVDEIGPQEIKRSGLWPALETVIPNKNSEHLLVVVRKSLLNECLDLIGSNEIKVFNIQEQDVDLRLLQTLKNHYNK